MSGVDRLHTVAGALHFCELRRAEMARCFERLGRFEMSGFSVGAHVFATRYVHMPNPLDAETWRAGEKLPITLVETLLMPRAALDFLTAETVGPFCAQRIRRYCALSRAVGVVVLNEMWWGQTESLEERALRPQRIADWDNRREVLYLKLEHQAAGVRAWRAEIHRNPTRLDEWRQFEGVTSVGNFANLLDRKEVAPS